MADSISIGDLRWPVTIYRRVQTTGNGPGIAETRVEIASVYAKIAQKGDAANATFWGDAQVDTADGWWIWIRWRAGIDTTCIVVRRSVAPDGATWEETFRVRRLGEEGGRKRFLRISAELEKRAEVV